MKRELRDEVIEALEWEPGVDASTIEVAVNEGVVTLRGRVRSHVEKTMAGNAVRYVHGVRAVANDLQVRFETAAPPGDTEIAKAVANSLEWDSAVPLNAITATVSDGWVTLNGEVEWQYQKSAAQIAAERTYGVKGVDNRVALVTPEPRPRAAYVKSLIERAFERSARIDAQHVTVRVSEGMVILSGTVTSLSERDEAERAAWSAPGVVAVEDRISVTPRLTSAVI